jgi:hypothetical protein
LSSLVYTLLIDGWKPGEDDADEKGRRRRTKGFFSGFEISKLGGDETPQD